MHKSSKNLSISSLRIVLTKNSSASTPTEIKTFSQKSFEFLEVLGRNQSAGRITHQARHIETGQEVVIKEFTFVNSSWEGYKMIEKEINTLSRLNHPNIPKYLGKYEFEKSLFLVQELIEAPSLASYGKLDPEEVKKIALSILEILEYLQSLNSPIFHRDIKPENIFYKQELKEIYLVDFGLAKGTGTVGLSTMIGGTMGFMSPEQLLGKKLSSASDLYSLGISLVCLLSGIPSTEINQLINHQFEIDFSKAIPNQISWEFRDWLKNLTHPSQEQRFPSAFRAKQELINVEVKSQERPLPQLNKKEPNLDEVNSQKIIFFQKLKSLLFSRIFISVVLGALGMAGLIISEHIIEWGQLNNLTQPEVHLKIVSLWETIVRLGLGLFVLWSSLNTFKAIAEGKNYYFFLLSIFSSIIVFKLFEQFFDYFRSLV